MSVRLKRTDILLKNLTLSENMKKFLLLFILMAYLQEGFCQSSIKTNKFKSNLSGLAIIRPDAKIGLSNAGWKYDRYTTLPSLDANQKMIVADIKGSGIITHIHFTRHSPAVLNQPEIIREMAARGVVLEIWFDNAEEPAVHCPLADFFADGCNGRSVDFSTPLIECVPVSYNCYIPMPFKTRAVVILRNDTDYNLMNYSYVEWEPIKFWDKSFGYFHATYNRKSFQLAANTDETFFEVIGTGHVIGRQFSVVTDEPLFKEFRMVMEGNNEIDIDGNLRQVDYLGSEDSFTFSWGFQRPYTGLRSGMPYIFDTDTLTMLSIYRFHDHQPIPFNKSLRWHINWGFEGGKRGYDNPSSDLKAPFGSQWAAALSNNRCWVDYATVHYWYQTIPGGYNHQVLPPPSERMKRIVHSKFK